jgi:predicted MFS family arabinose efflux permease
MGFIALAISLASCPALLSGSSGLKTPRKARKLVDKAAFRDRLFVIFTCASFACFLGYIIPYFYIPTYAQDHLGVSPSLALYILVIAIAASFFGRLTSGYVAHYAGNMLTWMVCALVSGVLSLCWIGIKSEKSFIAFSALWGKSASSLDLEQSAYSSPRRQASSLLDLSHYPVPPSPIYVQTSRSWVLD